MLYDADDYDAVWYAYRDACAWVFLDHGDIFALSPPCRTVEDFIAAIDAEIADDYRMQASDEFEFCREAHEEEWKAAAYVETEAAYLNLSKRLAETVPGIHPSVVEIASVESTDEIRALNNESSSRIMRDTGGNALKGYWGIFWEKDLVGYCVEKAADGKVQGNGLLLSDVFIEEKYRHYGLGTTLVYHVTAQLGEDVYCRKECTGFFLRLGFVESGDGLVYRHH